jgi:putative ABC transport system permease protein
MLLGAAVGTAVIVFTLGTSLDKALRTVAVTPTDTSRTAALAVRSPGRLDPQMLNRAAKDVKGLVSIEMDEPFNVGPPAARPGIAYTVVRSGDTWHPPLIEGRYIDERDHQEAAEPVIVIGQNLARDWLGSGPTVGSTAQLSIRGRLIRFQVVGVVGVRDGYTRWDDWVVLPGRFDQGRKVRLFTIKAAPDSDIDVVQAELASVLRRQVPGVELVAAPESGPVQSDEGIVAAAAFAMSLVVLIVAGINCGNLAVFWAWRRRREMGIRQALGASPWLIARLVMSEVLLLNFLGAGIGLLAYLAVREWTGLGPFMPFHYTHVVVGLGTGLLTGVVAGVGPALHVARLDPSTAIRLGG